VLFQNEESAPETNEKLLYTSVTYLP